MKRALLMVFLLTGCLAENPRAPSGVLEQIEAAEITAQQLATSITNQTCTEFLAGKCAEPGKSLMPDKALPAFDKVQEVRAHLRRAATLSGGGLADCLGKPRSQSACLAAAKAVLLEIERALLLGGAK
jgi:hypothetical protein